MGYAVYSERFLVGADLGWTYYYVPAGFRAVVQCVSAVNAAGSAGYVDLTIAGLYVLSTPVPVQGSVLRQGIKLVAYQGERIGLSVTGGYIPSSVHGSLFADSSNRSGPPADATSKPVPEPDPEPIPRSA